MSNYPLSARLKELRKIMKLTQKQFAELINVSTVSVSSYESGAKNPSLDMVINIATKCNVSIDWLCGLTERKSPLNSFTTYHDVFQVLTDICITKYEDQKSTILFPCFEDGMPDTLFVASEDSNFYNFFNEYRKIYELYVADTIDDEVYNFWVKKELNKYDFPLNKPPVSFNESL